MIQTWNKLHHYIMFFVRIQLLQYF